MHRMYAAVMLIFLSKDTEHTNGQIASGHNRPQDMISDDVFVDECPRALDILRFCK